MIHGFAGFSACSHAIYYFQGGTQGYTRQQAPYRGRARRRRGPDCDLSRVPDDRHGGQRQRDRGHQALAHRHPPSRPGCCPPRPATKVVTPTADIGAEGGKWWAVWTERSAPSGGEFAPQQLFQAKTSGRPPWPPADHLHRVGHRQHRAIDEPADGNGAAPAWTRRGPRRSSRKGRRTCGWPPTRTGRLVQPGWFRAPMARAACPLRGRQADLGGFTFLAFVRDGRIVPEAENTAGAWTSHVFLTPGDPRAAVGSNTFGSQFVAWTAANGVFYASARQQRKPVVRRADRVRGGRRPRHDGHRERQGNAAHPVRGAPGATRSPP